MTWWNAQQFYDEIDRLALWGVNLPLAFQGQEFTFDRLWRSVGLDEDEIGAWFSGPAFLPWNRMGNMMGFGGPLNPTWLGQQQQLQVAILTRMREFGMVPVLAGFAGHVPRALQWHYPNASFTNSSDWCSFPPQYGSDSLLEPTDPLFASISSSYHKMALEDFGDPTGQETPVFNSDMFNEMDPNSDDLTYLKDANAAVYQGMVAADNRSVLLQQAWLFHSGFWNYSRVEAYLSGIPIGKMLILDLNTEAGPVWQDYNSFFGHMWLWNSLITYGGRRGLYGDLDRLSSQPYVDLAKNPTNMIGVGFTPEATEMIPSQFDVIMEFGWRSEPVDPSAWFQAWAVRRYSAESSPSIAQAHTILESAAYNSGIDTASLESYPTIGDGMSHNTNATGLLAALRLFVAAAEGAEIDPTRGPFAYDLTDLHRQVLINIWSDLHAVLGGVYDLPASGSSSSSSSSYAATSHGRGASVASEAAGLRTIPEAKTGRAGTGGYPVGPLYDWLRVKSMGPAVRGAPVNKAPAAAAAAAAAAVRLPPSYNKTAAVISLSDSLLALLGTLDAALAADQNFLLGNWIADAVSWAGDNATMATQWSYNARNQVTLWGPTGQINDYAAKNGWSGLVGDYYTGRWSILFSFMLSSVLSGQPVDQGALDANVTAFEMAWNNQTDERPPTTPSGADPVALASASLAAFATFNASAWRLLPDTDVTVPPRSRVFLQVGQPNYAAVSADCPYLDMGDGSSLAACEASCLADGRCTLVNYDASGQYCVFRECSDPLHPILSPGYDGYTSFGLNMTAGPLLISAWHTDPGVLGYLCGQAGGACAGFTSTGRLYNDASTTVAAPGVTLYLPL
jgi:hypothetical protein